MSSFCIPGVSRLSVNWLLILGRLLGVKLGIYGRASTTPSTNTSSGALRTWPHVGQCGRPVAIHDPQSTRRAARARPGSWVLALDRAVRGEGQLIFAKSVSSMVSSHRQLIFLFRKGQLI